MTINLADNNPRIAYTVAQGVTQQSFAVPFEFFDDGDLSVYVDGTLKVEGVDYTVTGGDGSTGTITFVTATPPAVQQVTGATGGSTVVIFRSIPIERTSDFSVGADISRAALNEQLDTLVGMIADLKDRVDRTIGSNDHEVAPSLDLPSIANRKGKVLAFNATTGAVESGPNIAAVQSVANASADIQTVADNLASILDAPNQATAAASSASSASSSASAAASSASAAASSASSASASASSAAASFDSFDDRYLGAKSSNPSVDNDGNALIVGALYFDTTQNVMKVYSGSIWIAAYTGAGTGTVTSVSATVPTGFTVSGSPITASGTLAVSYDTGYQGYTTTEASKLSGIEALADVTDSANVSAALTSLGLTSSIAELNILDGVTSTAAELNILDGVTATTAEINKLAGTPAGLTATELGYVDGVTSAIQTQLDAKQPLDSDLTDIAGLTRARGSLIRGGASAWEAVALGTSGQVLTSNGTDAVWATPGITLLGTLTTTSGSSQTLSSLVLTGYKCLLIVFNQVSGGSTGHVRFSTSSTRQVAADFTAGSQTLTGTILVDLGTGLFSAVLARDSANNALASAGWVGPSGLTTASTSITFSVSTGSFDNGSITIYGVP